jgi:hypothetical protein
LFGQLLALLLRHGRPSVPLCQAGSSFLAGALLGIISAIVIKKALGFVHGEFLVGQIRAGKAAGRHLVGLGGRQAQTPGAEFLLLMLSELICIYKTNA